MQRRVRQHHAQLGRAGRDRRRRLVAIPISAWSEHDRPLRRAQQRPLDLAQLDERRGVVCGRDHQRERLVLPVLARPQRAHRRLVIGAAGEVKAADPLDRDDRAVAESGRRREHLITRTTAVAGSSVAVRIDQPDRRSALGARVRLGVKAPVGRILVLRPAGGAHLESGHRRQRSVVGHPAHDREARSAVGAVDERVPVAAILGIEQLAQAVGARRRVRCHRGVGRLAARALADRKRALAQRGERRDLHSFDDRQRWCVRGEPIEELGRRARGCPPPPAARRARRSGPSPRARARPRAGTRRGGSRRPGPCREPARASGGTGRRPSQPTSSHSAW